nr:leucine-rich repeat domain, L domain-like protein [Tanacetum cinerariifolium]
MREGRLRWFGHVKRRSQSAPVRRVEAMVVEGSGRRGRPKLRWEDILKMDMKELCLSEDMTSDRNAWRDRIRIRRLVAFLANRSLLWPLRRGSICLHFTSLIPRPGGIGYVVVVVAVAASPRMKAVVVIIISSIIFGTCSLRHFVNSSLSYNKFTGTIHESIGNMTQLTYLSHNFSGTIPISIGSLTKLKYLDLAANNFSGVIPRSIGSLTKLTSLFLSENVFYGTTPREFGNLTNLEVLYLDSLRSCRVENLDWLSSLSSLVVLIMDGTSLAKANNWVNVIIGRIPPSIGYLGQLETLSLYNNRFSGELPLNLKNCTKLEKVNEFSSILGLLKAIDLSSSNLTRQIPNEVTNLHGLLALDLSKNSLVGEIPQNICQMTELLTLNLSRNMLSGEMPSSMSDMHSLNDLDVSFNNLSERVPTSTQLQSFEPTRFTGNARLCGLPTTKKCPEDEYFGLPHVVKRENDGYSTDEQQRWFYVGGATGFATGFWIVCSVLLFNRQGRRVFFHFHDSVKDWVYVTVALFIAKWRRVARA